MRLKFKGFILGVCLGSMVAGTAAYAGSASIEVVPKNLKLWIDGVEAKLGQTGQFMYNDTVYVPLRLIGEALGKTVTWDEANQAISVDGPKYDSHIAAVYDGGFITKSEHARYIQVMQLLNPSYSGMLTDPSFIETMLRNHISSKVLAQRGQAVATSDQKENAVQQLADLKQSYSQNFGASGEDWDKRLSELTLSEADLTEFIENQLYATEYLKSTVAESDLRHEYDLNAANHNFDSATLREIFISLHPVNAEARTQEEALQRANEAIAKINGGTDFAEAVKTYSDDTGADDTGGQRVDAPLNALPAELKQAIADLPLDQLSEPILTANGYYIIRVEAKKTKTYDEVKEDISNYYVQQAYSNFSNTELPGLVISLNLK